MTSRNYYNSLFSVFFAVCLLAQKANAQINIEINSGVSHPTTVAIHDPQCINIQSMDYGIKIREVVINDLSNSGTFLIINGTDLTERAVSQHHTQFRNWHLVNANLLVTLQVFYDNKTCTVRASYGIWDVLLKQLVESGSYEINQSGWRRISHKIANSIYKKTLGVNGCFDSRIAFVLEKSKQKSKRLAIVDQDGANLIFLTDKNEYILSPRLDNKSQRLTYTTLPGGFNVSKLYVLDLVSGKKISVGDNREELAFAGNFSPIQNKLIYCLAHNGATNIYEIDLNTGFKRSLTFYDNFISTSPSYSNDASQILFNSNLGGGQSQIYVMDCNGSHVRKLSVGKGVYRTPSFSPNGEWIAFTKILGGVFYIGVMKQDGSDERLLTSGGLYEESPSWSSNSNTLVFSRQDNQKENRLFMIDLNGCNERKFLYKVSGSQPFWSAELE